jgi:hypothetical protein
MTDRQRAMTEMPVEWGKIREYALATGSHHPDYLDNPSAPIPPTFLATVVFWDEPGRGLRTPEAEAALAELGVAGGMDIRNILSAEQEYRFTGPLPRGGERLWLSHRFDGAEVKEGRRGGQLVFTRFAVEFRDATGELRAECLYTSVRTSQAATEAARP